MHDGGDLPLVRRLEPDLATLVTFGDAIEVVTAGPFHALLSRQTDWANFVMPFDAQATATEVAEALRELRPRYAEAGRPLRVQFKQPLYPALAPMLEQAGMRLCGRERLMLCTRSRFRPMAAAAVQVRRMSASDPEHDSAAYQHIWSEALGDGSWRPTPEAITAFRTELEGQSHCAPLATLNGEPVGTGFAAVYGESAEIMRIATVPAARRRGVAASVTSFLVRHAFDAGATLAYLTTLNPDAERVYARLGFQVAGDELEYC
jgi:GNAT superfamily N-acetyltransferase